MEDDVKTLVSDEIKRFRESYKVGVHHIERLTPVIPLAVEGGWLASTKKLLVCKSWEVITINN